MSALIIEYLKMRMEQISGEEKLHFHDCCRRNIINEFLDIISLVEKDGEILEKDDISV